MSWELCRLPQMILISDVDVPLLFARKCRQCVMPADAGTASADAQTSSSLWQRVPGGQPVLAACALYAFTSVAL